MQTPRPKDTFFVIFFRSFRLSRMDSPEIRRAYNQAVKARSAYEATLNRKLAILQKDLELTRPSGSGKKVPIVEEPERSPEKCFRDYLLAEILWLQNDIASERKWKQSQSKKLGKELLKHKYIVDRQSGIDLVEQQLARVSSVLATEVEKFWKGVNQLAGHRFAKLEAHMKRAANQKRLDALVDRTEKIAQVGRKRTRSEVLDEVEELAADIDRPVDEVLAELKGEANSPESMEQEVTSTKDEKSAYLEQVTREMTEAAPTGNSLSSASVSVAVPPLLRANLREYQHIGLQWLATLHERGLNGILADEMGLGKTLQTIALLAHLACTQGIWGPHLIVVPTSVMINWEIEFKKFLPGFKVMVYFGTPKERRLKRVGWRDDNVFNVCICSYALVLQDALVFRKKNWHYLILDEAHQIKNFKSQRWQNLLTFKTQRRLLLTGTPLQNDLIELWSLLHFLMPHIFTSHLEFQEWFAEPLSKAIEHSKLDEHSQLISRLHALIRPFLLRRLKRDVEKQMPSKYEHVVPVALSRRQQVLYDEFLQHRETRALLAGRKSGQSDYLGLMNVLMQLRKVCNHPDLLEPRPVRSPFVMDFNAIDYHAGLTRTVDLRLDSPKATGHETLSVSSIFTPSLIHTECMQSRYAAVRREHLSMAADKECVKGGTLFQQFMDQVAKAPPESEYMENEYVHKRYLERQTRTKSYKSRLQVSEPSIGIDGIRLLRSACENLFEDLKPVRTVYYSTGKLAGRRLVETASERLDDNWRWLSQFSAFTPPVIVSPFVRVRDLHVESDPGPRLTELLAHLGEGKSFGSSSLEQAFAEALHRPRLEQLCRLPDRRFLEWDCGKMRLLRSLLTKLRAEGHKVILFTQMSRMLDVIEAFANLCGFTYVRLDGATKVAERQLVVDRFNRDRKIFLFISSTRAGGVGINLTGADTVVFFDSDWNPAMDRQAMDRCHRIGQTRDVHIYRLVSEKTIEENIFVKQLQKRELDRVVIDQATGSGEKVKVVPSVDDLLDGLAWDRRETTDRSAIYGTHVLWERPEDETVKESIGEVEKLLAKVEDQEDVAALRVAMREKSTAEADQVEQIEGAANVEGMHESDPQYLALPEIVRHSVSLVEARLLASQTPEETPEDDEAAEWEELDNAAWSSEDDMDTD